MDDKDFVQRVVSIFEGCAHKQPEELSDLERTVIAIAAGCEYERTETGVVLKNPISIRKMGGRFIVDERRS